MCTAALCLLVSNPTSFRVPRDRRDGIHRDLAVQVDDAVDHGELLLRCVAIWVAFDGFQEFVPRTPVVAMVAKDESPHDPVVGVFRTTRSFLDAFLYLLNSFRHVAPLE